MDIEIAKEVLEALLFVSGAPLSSEFLCEKLELQPSELRSALISLKEKYSGKSGIHILEFGDNIQLASNSAYADVVEGVLNPVRERELTKAALETLVIIAYKQPVTRLEIENVRGVSCDYALSVLLKQNFIERRGFKDAIGKPALYGITDEFLKRFNLKSLQDLPMYQEYSQKIAEMTREEEEESVLEESLYGNSDIYKVEDEDEQVPEFLKGEDVERY